MAKKMNGLSPEFIIHPGETLKEMLQDRGMTQRELAIRTGVKEPHISGIVNCQKPISSAFAKKLEYALGVDASFWINLQANYEKELADYEEVNQVSKQELDILKKIKAITVFGREIGIISTEAMGTTLLIEWRKLLNLSSLLSIPEISQAGAYRLASGKNTDPYVLFAWLRISDLILKDHQVSGPFDLAKLKSQLDKIQPLIFENFETIQAKLTTYFAECGIKFAIIRHFPEAPVQGVIKKNDDHTLSLIMTVRYSYADVFWFSLFHEIGHIINQDMDHRLVDYEYSENEAEDRANEFAANALIDHNQYRSFTQTGDFSLTHIEEFSAAHEIPAYLLIGRLQRDNYLGDQVFQEEKVKYQLDKTDKKQSE